MRLRGEDKDFTTVWLTLGQRTLRYETYVMPAPEENAAELYEQLLRRNEQLVGAHFSIGIEDAVFLRGDLPVGALSEAELDRVIGTLFATVEQTLPGPPADRLRQPFPVAVPFGDFPFARLGTHWMGVRVGATRGCRNLRAGPGRPLSCWARQVGERRCGAAAARN